MLRSSPTTADSNTLCVILLFDYVGIVLRSNLKATVLVRSLEYNLFSIFLHALSII